MPAALVTSVDTPSTRRVLTYHGSTSNKEMEGGTNVRVTTTVAVHLEWRQDICAISNSTSERCRRGAKKNDRSCTDRTRELFFGLGSSDVTDVAGVRRRTGDDDGARGRGCNDQALAFAK